MSDDYGPYEQMGILAERMASHYQTDANLELSSHLAHYMEEVEVNIAAHVFDHKGFMQKICDRLERPSVKVAGPRHQDFVRSVIEALRDRISRHEVFVAG